MTSTSFSLSLDATLRWSMLPQLLPNPMAGHSSVVVDGAAWFFGGASEERVYGDVLRWDDREAGRAATKEGQMPGGVGRSRHATVVSPDGQSVLLLGGGDNDHVWADGLCWDLRGGRFDPNRIPMLPEPRWGHTATLVGSDIFVFGGHTGATMVGDLCVLNSESFEVASIKREPNTQPSRRAGHTATYLEESDSIVFFGGGDGSTIFNDTHIFDLASASWRTPVVSGQPPVARCAHTAVALPGTREPSVLVFGGGDGTRRFKDLYILEDRAPRADDDSHHDDVHTSESVTTSESLETPASSPPALHTRSTSSAPTSTGDMDNFLTACGVTQHASILSSFAAQAIDVDVIEMLTEQHLEDLGVTKLGDRLRIIKRARHWAASQQTRAQHR